MPDIKEPISGELITEEPITIVKSRGDILIEHYLHSHSPFLYTVVPAI